MNVLRKQIICCLSLLISACAVFAAFPFAKSAPGLPASFDSNRWKEAASTDYGIRQNMVDLVRAWAVGKSEAQLLQVLGTPDTTGVGGLLGVEWQPADGSRAWNYNRTPSVNTSHLGNAIRIYVKDGHAVKVETVPIGCD
jgi:hypothetical protein